jgi:hypothetical protein
MSPFQLLYPHVYDRLDEIHVLRLFRQAILTISITEQAHEACICDESPLGVTEDITKVHPI